MKFTGNYCVWNHSIIVSRTRSKVEKTTKNLVFSTFSWKKKILSDTPKMVVLAILRPNLKPLLWIEIVFSVNLTYSYSFFGWNLPGIIMSLESFHNYVADTVKIKVLNIFHMVNFFRFWPYQKVLKNLTKSYFCLGWHLWSVFILQKPSGKICDNEKRQTKGKQDARDECRIVTWQNRRIIDNDETLLYHCQDILWSGDSLSILQRQEF